MSERSETTHAREARTSRSLVSIVTYRRFEDGLELLADSQYGLQAGVYTQDVRKAFAAVKRLDEE